MTAFPYAIVWYLIRVVEHMTNDLTKGSIWRQIIGFTIPILLANLFQNLYSAVDSAIVGHYAGNSAFAAVSSTGSITFFVVGWAMGINSGFAIMISQRFGAGDEKGVRHYTAMSLYLCAIMAVVMTTALLTTNGWVLKLMQTQESLFTDTYVYLKVTYIGLAATIAYNFLAALLRSLGDSRAPLVFLIISSCINFALDMLFVAAFKWGVSGAAAATVISQGVSALLCLVYIAKKFPILRMHKEDMGFSFNSAWKLLGLGIPMALQFSITAIGTMIVQVALNQLGEVYITAYGACSKIQNITSQFFTAFGSCIATFTGQNAGAGRMDRVRKGVKITVILTLICSVVDIVLMICFGSGLVRIFVSDVDERLLSVAQEYFNVMAWFYPMLSLVFVYRNVLQGMGNGLVPMLGGVMELAARIAAILLLSGPFGYTGVCAANPLAWTAALIPTVPVYYYTMYIKPKRLKKQG